jgi:hypothetical protein
MQLTNLIQHLLRRVVVGGMVIVMLAFAGVIPAGAQTSPVLSTRRVGGGLTFANGGGVGLTGGIHIPLREYDGIRSLGVIGAGQFLNYEFFSHLSFGGGVRWTRLLENVTAPRNFRLYIQGVYGFSLARSTGFSTTDHGVTVGGGAGFSLTEQLDGFAEFNLARVASPEFDFSYSSWILLFGVSVPIGER